MKRWAKLPKRRERRSKLDKSLSAKVLCCAIAGLGAMPAAHADDMSKLQAEIHDLSVRLDQLKMAQSQTAKNPVAVSVAQAPTESLPPTKAE